MVMKVTLTLLFENNVRKSVQLPVQSIKRQRKSEHHHHEHEE